jgi:hypothetical protein
VLPLTNEKGHSRRCEIREYLQQPIKPESFAVKLKSPRQCLTEGAERGGFAMTAAPSNTDVKKASLKAFTHAMEMSAFV